MFFTQKGTVLHEVLNLPLLWLKLLQVSSGKFTEQYYQYGKHTHQYLLILHPPPFIADDRLLIYFHGGAWRLGRPEYFRSYARPFLERGFTVVFPSVRRTPRFGYFSIREDLTALLRQLSNLGLKREQVIIGGMSSGGNLAALTLFNEEELMRADWFPSDFSGAFFMGAPLDLEAMPDSEPLLSFTGPRHSEQFRQANPVSYLHNLEHSPWPLLFIHGTHDGLVPFPAAAKFVDRLRPVHQGRIDFHRIDNGTHLDAISWVYADNEIRHAIMEWIVKI